MCDSVSALIYCGIQSLKLVDDNDLRCLNYTIGSKTNKYNNSNFDNELYICARTVVKFSVLTLINRLSTAPDFSLEVIISNPTVA